MRLFGSGVRKFVSPASGPETGKAVVIGVGVGEFCAGVGGGGCGLRPGEKQRERKGEAHET